MISKVEKSTLEKIKEAKENRKKQREISCYTVTNSHKHHFSLFLSSFNFTTGNFCKAKRRRNFALSSIFLRGRAILCIAMDTTEISRIINENPAVASYKVRVDTSSNRASVIDVVILVTGHDQNYSGKLLRRVEKRNLSDFKNSGKTALGQV